MIKAKKSNEYTAVKHTDGGISEEPPVIPEDDGIVMVCFPRQTWDKVQGIAVRANCAPAEVLSIALQELEKKLMEK